MDKVSAQALQLAQAYDALMSFKAGDASGTANNQWMHGMTGMMNTYGLNRDVFNTMVLPKLGLLARLPVTGTNEMRPLVAFLTGQKAITGDKQVDNCSPCQVAGDLKTGKITSVFGKTCLSTKTLDLSGDLGAVKNRGEFKDFRLIGGPDPSFNKAAPTMPGGMANILNRELDAELFKLYVAWGRDVWARLLWEGNPSNNTGAYAEFRGLDTLINTGYQDAETGAYLPSADAIVLPVNYNIRTNGQTFVELLTYDNRRARHLASRTGLDPVEFVYVMPEMMFYELTAIWPCSYLTNRCFSENTSLTANVNAEDMRRMTDEMRMGNFLTIDGKRYEVIIDDTIRETEGAGGEFSASIYRVPLRVIGSMPALYVEYYDYDNEDARAVRNTMSAGDEIMTSDGGRWIWNRRKNGFCVSMDATERSRVRLDTPFLATRFTSVKYTPLQLTRSGFPGDGNRFYNGGNTVGIAPSLYPPTVYTA